MPRGRGGRRQGQSGRAYSNRSDLNASKPPTQPVKAPTGQPYGVAGQQRADQQAIPLPQATPSGFAVTRDPDGRIAGVQPNTPPPTSPSGSPMPAPGELGPLDAPTDQPNVPLTDGIPTGPGRSADALNIDPADDVRSQLRALFQAHPLPVLAELIAEAE